MAEWKDQQGQPLPFIPPPAAEPPHYTAGVNMDGPALAAMAARVNQEALEQQQRQTTMLAEVDAVNGATYETWTDNLRAALMWGLGIGVIAFVAGVWSKPRQPRGPKRRR